MRGNITVSSLAVCAGDLARMETTLSVLAGIIVVALVAAVGVLLWQELDR